MRILIADDHEIVRKGVRSLLNRHPDFQICGEASDGQDAIAKAKDLRPDVIVMDISMPGCNGLEATRALRSQLPTTEVVILSQHEAEQMMQQAFTAGARGYVVKSSVARDLLTAIEKVSRHEFFSASNRHGTIATHVDAQEIIQRSAALEQALRESEERFRLTFEQAAVGMAHVAENGRWLRLNQKFRDILGYPVDELLQLRFQDVTHPDDLGADVAQAAKVAAGELTHYSMEKRYIRKDGRTVWVNLTVAGVHDPEGKLKYFISVVEDISARRQAEERLRSTEQQVRDAAAQLELVTSRVGAAMSRCSRDYRYLWVNQRYAEWLQRPAGEIVGQPIAEILGREAFDDLHPYFERVLAGEAVAYEKEVNFTRLGRRWRSAIYNPTFDSSGACDGWVGVVLDVTDRKRTEQATGLLAAIVDSSDDAIVSKNLNGVITSWNKGAERLFGYSAAEAVSRHITLIIPQDRLHEEDEILRRLRQGERIDHFETVRIRKDGTQLDVSLTISPLKDSTGRTIGASKIARDITERKRAEKLLTMRGRSINALLQLSDELHRSRSLEDVYRAALDSIMAAAQCDRASILLYDTTGVMRFVSWRGLSDEYRNFTQGHSPWTPEVKNPVPIAIHNIEDADLSDALKEVVRYEGIVALAFIPLVTKGKLIGKFMTYFNTCHSFAEQEIEVNVAIARQLALGIERKRAEEALRQSEERFRLMVETTPECVKVVDADGRLLHMNPSGLAMVGAASAEMALGKSVYDVIAPEDRERYRALNESVCRGERGTLEFDIVGFGGVRRHMQTHAVPLRNPDGSQVHLAVTRDISKSKQTEQNLRTSEERLRALAESLEAEVRARTAELELRNAEVLRQSEEVRDLSWRLLRAQDDERRRIARELHDSAGQTLTVLGMNLSQIAKAAHAATPQVTRIAEESEQLVRQLSREIRTTSYLLHPPLLEESGISAALNFYIDGLRQRSGLEIELVMAEDFGRLSRDMELVIFRVVQECLTNIHRHSGSKSAEIRIARESNSLIVEVKDQGKGITPEKLKTIQSRNSGVGIRGMRERIRQFHGVLTMESNSSGTLVKITIPLHRGAVSPENGT